MRILFLIELEPPGAYMYGASRGLYLCHRLVPRIGSKEL